MLELYPIGVIRSPCRPNSNGMSPVRLLGRQGGLLRVVDLDALDGTPE